MDINLIIKLYHFILVILEGEGMIPSGVDCELEVGIVVDVGLDILFLLDLSASSINQQTKNTLQVIWGHNCKSILLSQIHTLLAPGHRYRNNNFEGKLNITRYLVWLNLQHI